MDFFGAQDSRRTQSAVLLVFFVVVLLVMALVVHVVSVLVHYPMVGDLDFARPKITAIGFIVLLWLISLMGCYFRFLDVKEGGASLARRFGAVEAGSNSRDRNEALLIDIVAELAIASACGAPQVYVMRREYAINAFVVGGFSGKEALVVSQGALQNLNRDQLAAIVAHEYGHISQGDIPMNMYLLVVLGGLNAIDEVGQLLMVRTNTSYYLQPGLLVGFVIRVIGSIGVFFGRLVRSAYTRQREYLADACAVQFTRSPEHLATALNIVREARIGQPIHSIHAEEIAHLCFQGGDLTRWYKRLFSTHPPIQKRIDAIYPHFELRMRSRKRSMEKANSKADSVWTWSK